MVAWRGIFMVFGAFLVHLTLGTIYTFGNMTPYIASYMRIHQGLDVSLTDMSWIYAAMVSCQGLLMVTGGVLERRLGPMATSLLGCTLMSSGVALTYFTIDMSFLWVVLTYGVMFGAGISIAYISLLSCGMKWFPRQRGLVSGIIVGGFGLGAFVFNQVQTDFLNPDNVPPNTEGYFPEANLLDKVPQTFLLLGGIYGIMQLIGCFLVARAPNFLTLETTPLLKDLNADLSTKSLAIEKVESGILMATKSVDINFTPMEMLKTREFYLLWLTFLFNNQTVNFSNAMYKAYGMTFISDDYFLAMVGAFASIFNAGGRIVWGIVIDYYPYKIAMRVLCTLVIALLLTLPVTGFGGQYMYSVWICALYMALSGSFVLFPTCVSRTFGPEHAGTNYGLVFSNSVFGGPLTAILTQTLTDVLGYTGMFYLLAGFSSLSFLLTLPFRESIR